MTPSTRRSPLADPELSAYSIEHLAYEVTMLFFVQDFVSRKFSARLEQGLLNMVTESFATHVRNLVRFLYTEPSKAWPDDVIAYDFFDDPSTWSSARPALSPTLEAAWERADKEIAHLTTKRIAGGPPRKAWQVTALIAELRPLLRLFVANASPKRLHRDFAAQVT